ncbi:MAG: phosphatidylinositol-specific phospholipase C domain-containing protein [Clostridiales bacterium]|nr:phosphatidylinositol-specific phospholipase C domain-containing protein [Clostridiales bacterium]
MNTDKNLKSWMKSINGNIPLFRLNICGTHDCVTRYVQFSHISKCQNMSIYDQLKLGIRALDIRVQSKNDRLKMVHGIAKVFNNPSHFSAQMDMEDVLAQCYRFLKENSSETIIFQFKNDSGKENEKCFDNLFDTYISKDADKWFCKNRCPLLDEARGKIVLVRRCKMTERMHYNDKNTGIDFSKWIEQDTPEPYPLTLKTSGENEMTFIVQDRFKYKPIPRWSECIKPFLDSMSEFDGKYIINYLSTAGGLKGPFNNSKYINTEFMKYPLDKNKYYGTIYTDFPTEGLVEKIITLNNEIKL